ncbi:glutathione S-transferase family protein (plasmid) [Salipiger sp. H15]|uniref:Glutathione S-transferase family protein n=1 Tax=Alloyangia sp. H15 TaxID=3029062 RepID=A0AAU8AQ60_9RHOB
MKLLGRRTSVNVQKVAWTLAELGVDHETVEMGGVFGGLDTPEYRALNPIGKVPTLIDGGLCVWESNAIVRYLAGAYGEGGFGGQDIAGRTRADIWMEWFQNNVYAAFTSVFHNTVRLPPSQRDPAARAAGLGVVTEAFRLLEARLSEGDFLAGDRLTMGDIPAGSALFRYYTMEIERPELPALAEYYARLCERPAYREHVMVSYDSLRMPGD